MSTPTITPQPQENQVEKTLSFLEQHFPDQRELGIEYLQKLLLNPTQHLPALAVTIPHDNTQHRLPQLTQWLRALIKYVEESKINEVNRSVDVRDQIEFKYLYYALYEEFESLKIHNLFTFVCPKDVNGSGEVAIIPLPKLPEKLVSLQELTSEIPDFVTFLQSRTAHYPQSGELYFNQEIYRSASPFANK
jgi:hypothetical protein